MSNKIVPTTYRAVIDDVISAIRPAFDEFGVADDVLQELLHKWETKVIASRVADFDPPAGPAATAHHPYATTASSSAARLPQYAAYVPPTASAPVSVKTEPYSTYSLPPLPGPQFPAGFPQFPTSMQHAALYRLPQSDGPSGYAVPLTGYRMPQVDGPSASPSDSDDDDDYDAVPQPPRASHPSLAPPPRPAVASSSTNTPNSSPSKRDDPDPEAINSDLDDSDTETEDEAADDAGGPETDIVFCTYDKVARVKNKWKCVLKDGMVHSGGKDYLFTRCTGEFEW
ncbi:transcription factor IIA alpha/beta subunit [Mycena belliarum]|uniref:Transcription factor IIA alpha/beta subunit n=1 Tax=Mycena belliarum TaxID=1033014 RepID=A0AAD6TKS2_9AGAR|nr:transcription factor IIA alpha/beta subunit [Mycena belliae]